LSEIDDCWIRWEAELEPESPPGVCNDEGRYQDRSRTTIAYEIDNNKAIKIYADDGKYTERT
jgi:hypothetical protein